MKAKILIALLGGLASTALFQKVRQPAVAQVSIGDAVARLISTSASLLETKALATDTAAVDRLVLIKNLYFFVNGGPDGTWPDGPSGELTGHNAPSEDMKEGMLGIVNKVVGSKGAVIEFLEAEGYTSCESLPSTNTTFDVTDEKFGALEITVGASTRPIPTGLVNSGTFEKRIYIAKASDDSAIAAVHLHCSSDTLTMLVRMDAEMETEGEIEAVEAIVEGSLEGPDMHLQWIAQNANSGGRDMALEFKTSDGDAYTIHVAYTSGLTDSNGNGPAHLLAGVAGTRTGAKATLHVMGGNSDMTAVTASDSASTLPFDSSQTVMEMAAGNKFCLDTTTAADTTDCPTLTAPSTPGISGLAAWTLDGLYDVRQGVTNVSAMTSY